MGKIQVLEEIEHIRKRPQMYIGSIETPDHLVTELLDNSLDEVINGYADRVELGINKDSSVTVTDTGRGIPVQDIDLKGKKEDSVVVLCTKLFSGTKFDNRDYQYLVGQHGVGLVVVNALSLYMTVTTGKYHYKFKDGKFVSKEELKTPVRGTSVTFRPDERIFKSLQFSLDKFVSRLRLVTVMIPKLIAKVNGNQINSSTIDEFIRNQLQLNSNISIFHTAVEGKVDEDQKAEANVYIAYDMNQRSPLSIKQVGNVNLRPCEGTYLTNISTSVAEGFRRSIPKSYILEREDLKIRMRIFVNLKVNEPHFDSQAKVRYTGPALKGLLKKLSDESAKLYKKESSIRNAIEEINNYKIIRRANNNVTKSYKKRVRLTIGNPLRDCNKHPGKRIYIVEGPSAGNTLTSARDPSCEAVFPMQGKIINAASQTIDKVMNNKFVKYLLESIGVHKLGEPFDSNFEKFVVLADADCVSGNTEIQTLNKGNVKIKDLYKKFKGEIISKDDKGIVAYDPSNYFYVWSYDAKLEKLVPKRAYAVMKKTTKNSYIRVTLDNNKTLVTTKDHKFLLRNGEYIQAKDLQPMMSLMPFYSLKTNKSKRDRKVSKIETIENGPDVDFYDMIVEDTHNFATGEGCIIHNCDGLQISMLVMLLFYKIMPYVIKDGMFQVLSPPLYGATKGKKFIPIYNVKVMEDYKEKGFQVHRFKGLGEMTNGQMKIVITKGKLRTVQWSDKASEHIKKLFSDSNEKRKLLDIPDAEIERVLFNIK